MGIRGYRHAVKEQGVQRSAGVALAAIAGILAGLVVFGLEATLVWTRTMRGFPLGEQSLDFAVMFVITIVLVRLYWGVWDLVGSAWWTHILLGPPLVIGLVILSGYAPQMATLLAHHMKNAEVELVALVLRWLVLVIAVIEAVTVLVLLGARSAFGIGRQKPLWERVRR